MVLLDDLTGSYQQRSSRLTWKKIYPIKPMTLVHHSKDKKKKEEKTLATERDKVFFIKLLLPFTGNCAGPGDSRAKVTCLLWLAQARVRKQSPKGGR